MLAEALATFGAISTMADDAGTGHIVCSAHFGVIRRWPRVSFGALVLVVTGAIPGEFVRALQTGRAQTINTRTHNFMDATRVANAAHDPVTQSRLDACVFKGAVKNRRTGEWEAVPMCAVNAQRWSDLYDERLVAGGQVPGAEQSIGA